MSVKPPVGLEAKGQRFWSDITKVYDLGPHELLMLEDCCREADLIDRLEQDLAAAELVVKGSMGQPVASPLVTEIRQHRSTLARLIAALKLPADDGGAAAERSSAARKAANARWGARRGA